MSGSPRQRLCLQQWLLLSFVVALAAAKPAAGETAEIVSLKKIWDQGFHNAFTDLLRFRNQWYCTFREAEAHVKGDGRLRVLTSADGEAWHSAALLAEAGVDLRDPKLSITADGRLMILAGGSVYEQGTYRGRQPRVVFSKDGLHWTPPHPILSEGDWLWRITWHEGRGYGVSYLGAGGGQRAGFLYSSTDGIHYERIAELKVPGVAEVTLRFLPDGEMMALARRETDTRHGWIGTSKPPYTEWKWHETNHRFGGPNFILLPDGSLWAAGREHSAIGPKTVLARMGRATYQPVLTLPSGGDTSYPGLVWHDNLLWTSYYSSHEGKASIYLAKIRLSP